jgi:hypothetical protein
MAGGERERHGGVTRPGIVSESWAAHACKESALTWPLVSEPGTNEFHFPDFQFVRFPIFGEKQTNE